MNTFEEQAAALNEAGTREDQRRVPLDPPLPPLQDALKRVVSAGPWNMAQALSGPGIGSSDQVVFVPRMWNGPAPAAVPGQLVDQHWYKITNIGHNAADIWVYAEIGGWGITAEGLVSELAALNVAEITVHLNSPGGDVFDGIAIMNALRDHPANVTVKVDALAASIASVIAQAGNKIIMGNNSMMMIHNASGYAMGEAEDLRKMADLLDETTTNIASVYAQRAGGTVAEWQAVMDAETWYSASEAVKAGLADEVAPLPTERDATKAAAKFDLSNFAHPPVITVTEPDVPRETEPVPGWNPDLFKTAVAAAVPQPVTWDPDVFKTAVAMVVNDSPVPPSVSAPAPAGPAAFDPDVFTLAMREARRT